MAAKLAFPRLNLAKEHAEVLAFDWVWDPDPSDATRNEVLRLLSDHRFLSAVKYTRNKISHLLVESIADSEPTSSVWFYVRYDAGHEVPAGRPPQSLVREGEFLSAFSHIDRTFPIHCHVDFVFPFDLGDQTGLWFPLPIDLGSPDQQEDEPATEIRGIRGVKLGERLEESIESAGENPESVEYSFILDRPENRDVNLSVDFTLQDSVTDQLPNNLLNRARAIARGLGLS